MEGIKEKIRKLLALGKSPNYHEAIRAMAKARELMAKHNIDSVEETQPQQVHHKKIKFWNSAIPSQEAQILTYLVNEFRCDWAIAGSHRDGYSFAIFGTADDIDIAIDAVKLAYKTFCNTWRAYYKSLTAKQRKGRAKLRIDYCMGFRYGFESQLKKDLEEQALVLVLSEEVKEAARQYGNDRLASMGIAIIDTNAVSTHKPKPKPKKKQVQVNMSVWAQGYKDGRHVKQQDQLTVFNN